MELMISAGKTVPKLQLEFGLAVERVYTGSFMTSLDMAGLLLIKKILYLLELLFIINTMFLSGFSISIMKADQTLLQLLDAACGC